MQQIALCAEKLREAGIENPRREARLLLAHVLGVGVETLIADPHVSLSESEIRSYETMICRRVGREPVSRIVGKREFWSLDLGLTPDVLDPRPESETLIEGVLQRLDDRSRDYEILDLGTGSGCLLLALLTELPNAGGTGLDFSPGAVEAARHNAARLGLSDRARFREADWNDGISGRWDIVVSNPPYVETSAIRRLQPEVREFDPIPALDGGVDGLEAYRAIVPRLSDALAPLGWAGLEIGLGQADSVRAMLAAAGLVDIAILHDLAGVPRTLLARMPSEGIGKKIKKTVGKGLKHL
jgi:release factor glutamine methyltransferase